MVTGGTDGTADVTSAEVYDPATGQWSLTASMSTARLAHAAVLPNSGKVLVAGGVNGPPNTFPESAELYDPALEHGRRPAASRWDAIFSPLRS